MNFSQALDALKSEDKVFRTGWHGADMRVSLASPNNVIDPQLTSVYEYKPFLIIKIDGAYQPGWVPSQGDLLADDWEIV